MDKLVSRRIIQINSSSIRSNPYLAVLFFIKANHRLLAKAVGIVQDSFFISLYIRFFNTEYPSTHTSSP